MRRDKRAFLSGLVVVIFMVAAVVARVMMQEAEQKDFIPDRIASRTPESSKVPTEAGPVKDNQSQNTKPGDKKKIDETKIIKPANEN